MPLSDSSPVTWGPLPAQPRLAVIICTVGRPDCVQRLLPMLASQVRRPDRVLLVVTRPEDVCPLPQGIGPGMTIEVLISAKGLPRQRNMGLDAVTQGPDACHIVVFFDDDFLPSQFALAGVERAFSAFPYVAGLTGQVLADGINSAGITPDVAQAMIADHDRNVARATVAPRIMQHGLTGLYGCNMAYRLDAIGDVRFDERLPLYAWQEDIDFGVRVPGAMIRTDAFAGVHLGTKSGRETAGRRLGYSQMVNPWYLWRKGTLPPRQAVRLAARNFLANHARVWRPEPWIDRRERARGNRKGLFEIMLGRAAPERILDF